MFESKSGAGCSLSNQEIERCHRRLHRKQRKGRTWTKSYEHQTNEARFPVEVNEDACQFASARRTRCLPTLVNYLAQQLWLRGFIENVPWARLTRAQGTRTTYVYYALCLCRVLPSHVADEMHRPRSCAQSSLCFFVTSRIEQIAPPPLPPSHLRKCFFQHCSCFAHRRLDAVFRSLRYRGTSWATLTCGQGG